MTHGQDVSLTRNSWDDESGLPSWQLALYCLCCHSPTQAGHTAPYLHQSVCYPAPPVCWHHCQICYMGNKLLHSVHQEPSYIVSVLRQRYQEYRVRS